MRLAGPVRYGSTPRLRRVRIVPKRGIEKILPQLIRPYLSAVRGGGYVRVLSVAVAREVGAGLLRPVLEDWSDAGLPFCVVRSRARALDDDLSAFTDFVAELVPNTDDDCAVRSHFKPAQRGSLTGDNRVSKRRP